MNELMRAEHIKRDVKNYQREGEEAWKLEHNQAMACFEVQELVLDGNQLFDAINRLDEGYRSLVFDKIVPYSEAMETLITNLLRQWMDSSERLLSLFSKLENDFKSRSFDFTSVEELNVNIGECKAMLQSTNNSLVNDSLVEFRDTAIDQLRAGATIEIGSFGD